MLNTIQLEVPSTNEPTQDLSALAPTPCRPSTPVDDVLSSSSVVENREVFLKRKLNELSKIDIVLSKRIRHLQQRNWYKKKKIDLLCAMIAKHKNENVLSD